MADIEAAALSGELFQRSRSKSPTRSESTVSPNNTDDEGLGSEVEDAHPRPLQDGVEEADESSTNLLPPGRRANNTGPKGVIEDRKAHSAAVGLDRETALLKIRNDQLRKGIIAGSTSIEDNPETFRVGVGGGGAESSIEERAALEAITAERRARRREELERAKREKDEEEETDGGRRRGGLKEVGQEGFLLAVERRGWVVVLIYEPGIPRCQSLLASMLHLSLNLPSAESLPIPISLFRARATSLSFSLLPHTSSTQRRGSRKSVDEDGEEYYEEEEEGDIDGSPDPDVLPSMLAYKNGELEKTWIRVDWEVKEDGVEGLLRREGILPRLDRLSLGGRDLLGSDDDD